MRNLLIPLVFGVFILCAACSTNTPLDKAKLPKTVPTGLSELQFPDIPAPRGFRLVTKSSFSYEVGDLRLASFHYVGCLLSPMKALEYCTTEMTRPVYGWTLVETPPGRLWATLRKGSHDQARVSCERVFDTTRVTINVNYGDDTPRTRP